MNLFEDVKKNLKDDSVETNYIINNGDYILSILTKSIGGEADLLVKAKDGKGNSAIIDGYDQVSGFEFTEEDEPFYSEALFATEDIENLFHRFEPNVKITSIKRMGYDEDLYESEKEKASKDAARKHLDVIEKELEEAVEDVHDTLEWRKLLETVRGIVDEYLEE